MFKKFNENFAKKMTLIFGTMWMCYAFMLYGLLSLIPQLVQYQDKLLYWSNWIQLWSLPLIMVGQNVIGKTSEKREQETHDIVMEEITYIKKIHNIEINAISMELEQQKYLIEIITQLKDGMEIEKDQQQKLIKIMLQLEEHMGK